MAYPQTQRFQLAVELSAKTQGEPNRPAEQINFKEAKTTSRANGRADVVSRRW